MASMITATPPIDGVSKEPASTAEILEQCKTLAEQFASRAGHYDEEGTFPIDNFEDLKSAGLLSMMVPKGKGGLGLDFLTYTKALERLAMGDGSTALTFNMHNIAAGSLAEVNTEGVGGERGRRMNDFRDWAFNEMVENKKVFASSNSEPGIGAHFSKLKTTYERVDGGFIINGAKSFVSMAGYADYYVMAARKKDSSADVPTLSFFVVELDTPGVRIERVWNTMGMRATSSENMYLDNVFVPNDRLFLGSEGMGIYKITREPHWVIGGYIGAYLGICQATFDYMVQHLRRKKIPGTDTSVIQREWVQHSVGELYVGLEATRSVVYESAALVDKHRGAAETNVALHRSKYMASEFAPHLASQAIRLCGGSSITKKLPLERFYRDARCGGLMPATSDECLLYAGKAALGIDITKLSETYW